MDKARALLGSLGVSKPERKSTGETEHRLVLSMIDRVYQEIDTFRAQCTQEALRAEAILGHRVIQARDETRHTIHSHILRCWNFMIKIKLNGIEVPDTGKFMEEMQYLHQTNCEAWDDFVGLVKTTYPTDVLIEQTLDQLQILTIDDCQEDALRTPSPEGVEMEEPTCRLDAEMDDDHVIR